MSFVLALDQGTTSSRALLFDRTGAIRGAAQREFPQHFPNDGWVEHDPADLWNSQLATARDALKSAHATAAEIAAIGISNQRETTLLWERGSGKPVAPAIVWQDRRTAARCAELTARGAAETVSRKTGLVLDPYFSATKIGWLLDNVDGLRERAQHGELAFGTVDTWLIWNLTAGAVHATDYTNASRTLLFDIATLDWDEELLELFGVPRAVLPQLRPSVCDFGKTAASVFGVPVTIGGVAGDQQAALFGQAGFRRGLLKNTYGTGSFLMLDTGNDIVRSQNGLLTTVAFSLQPHTASYALEGAVFVTGAAVQWLRDGLGIIASSAEIEPLARSVADSGGVYFVPALTGLGAPYWDPHARGAIFGITRATTRAHLARATLEAMAYQSADVADAMARDAGFALRELRVDGGAAVNDLAMQFQADILGIDVVRPRVTETTALGAAYLAGLHAGYWNDLDEIERLWQQDRRFTPSIDASHRQTLLTGWHTAIQKTRTNPNLDATRLSS
ncbi:MAG TPA: glycerol kinase GlpK [Candidatus Baltobacteraceae bacterium]|nr:glycerol kinase GlpK [Candidatus Baltobacteraceae bacterium]